MEVKTITLSPDPREIRYSGADDHLFFSLESGNGQIGGSTVTFNGQTLAKGNLSKPVDLGPALYFRDQVLVVVANILDSNTMTNKCVITTTFRDQSGHAVFSAIDEGEAPESGIASFSGRYLIKVLGVLLFLFGSTLLPFAAFSQDLDFNKLETPSSPGFILFDQSPSAIERPTTPQGLGIALLAFYKSGKAIETAPFWLKSHPKLTAEQMYHNKFPVLYNLAISLATLDADSGKNFALGIRTRLIQHYGKQELRLDSIKGKLELALADLDLNKVQALREQYADCLAKPLFSLDAAAALGGGSVDNSFNSLKLNRWAAWVALNWRPNGEDFYLTVLSRYLRNESFNTYSPETNLVDLGTRLNYDLHAFSLSLEYLQRFNSTGKTDADFRIAVICSYKVSDAIYLTSTFGKNFTDVNNIIALAGINFGYSRRSLKAF